MPVSGFNGRSVEQVELLASGSSRSQRRDGLVAECEDSDEMALWADLYSSWLHLLWWARVPLVCVATETLTNQASVTE